MIRSLKLFAAVAACTAMAASLASCSKGAHKGGPGLPHPMFTAMPAVVGLPTALDGSASTDPAGRALSYAWHLSSVPQGSTLTDAAFADGSAAMTTFVADVGGSYGVTLVVTAADGAINQQTQSIVVPAVPIFYAAADSDGGATRFAPSVIASDATGARSLGCANQVDLGTGSSATGDFSPAQEVVLSGMAGVRAFDGATPLMAFVRIGLNVAGDGWAHQLLVAGPQSDCAAHPPTRIDAPSQLGAADWLYFFPRFSPDGKRLAVLALGATGTGNVEKLFTVGVDGTGFRVVRTFPTSSDQIVPPTWIDNATLAWREFTGTGSSPPFRIVSAADAAGAGDTSAMTVIDCPASMPFTGLSQFEAVDATTFVFAASTIAGSGSAPGLTNLYRVPAGSCTAANKLTNETSAGHFSGDFSLSPDGKTVVFASTIGSAPATVSGGQLTDIFVVPVDGSAAPRRVAGDPMFIDAGPRFVAGGRQIVWTRLGVVPMDGGSGADLPQSSALMLANLDGTNVRTLVDVTARAGETHMAIGGLNMGNSCAVGGGAASAGGMAVLAVVVLAGLARRRRGATSRT